VGQFDQATGLFDEYASMDTICACEGIADTEGDLNSSVWNRSRFVWRQDGASVILLECSGDYLSTNSWIIEYSELRGWPF
jgi:hypothetical protein